MYSIRRLIPFLLMALLAVPSWATTIHVASGGNLQTAINSAALGDTITLEAGATFTGSFNLPDKGAGSSYITITSDANLTVNLPAGVRVGPGSVAYMAKCVTNTNTLPVFQTAASAHHYKLIGLEICPSTSAIFLYDMIRLGDATNVQNSLGLVPHHVTIDRCFIHGYRDTANNMSRAIALNMADTDITNCYISGVQSVGDAQAICGWNGPGPWNITNCFLEATGENIMIGGDVTSISGLIPSDILIDRCTFSKSLTWKSSDASYAGRNWDCKNLFEIKSGQRVTLSNCILEHCWAEDQDGNAMQFTPRNVDGTNPWSNVVDISVLHNIFRDVGGWVSISGTDDLHSSGRTTNVTLRDNLVYGMDRTNSLGAQGDLTSIGGVVNLTFDHNTVIDTGHIAVMEGNNTGFVFTNNIVAHNSYGIIGSGYGVGNPSLAQFAPSATIHHNVIMSDQGNYSSIYPSGQFWLSAWSQVGFSNFAGDDYTLAGGSIYNNAASDGTDVGYRASGIHTRSDITGASTHVRSISGASTHVRSISGSTTHVRTDL